MIKIFQKSLSKHIPISIPMIKISINLENPKVYPSISYTFIYYIRNISQGLSQWWWMTPHDPSHGPRSVSYVSYLLWLNPFIPAYHFYLDRPVHGPGNPTNPGLTAWQTPVVSILFQYVPMQIIQVIYVEKRRISSCISHHCWLTKSWNSSFFFANQNQRDCSAQHQWMGGESDI